MPLHELLPPLITIPPAPFLMGTPERELGALARAYGGTRESYREEAPQHWVTLPAFEIGQMPVTNALYAAYVAAAGARPPAPWRGPRPPAELLEHPAVDLTWHDAVQFCAWLTDAAGPVQGGRPGARFRLPSEAEWEHAARGTAGRVFPWGDEWDSARANVRESSPGGTTPVWSYGGGASPYGCLDMAGNIWEWTASLDAPYPYRPGDGRERPDAPGRRILRGGCYANPHGYARCACRFRLAPAVRNDFLGFRLARSL